MKFDKNLAAIHGYLCGDGYVIKNPKHQKHKYYHIGFRNFNDVLLRDFQDKFNLLFDYKPHITNEGRCRIQNKDIYYKLTKNYSYYSYEWTLPKLSKVNLKYWLRAFFDCEGWVNNQLRKNRAVSLECCNEEGTFSIQKALSKFKIDSKVRKKTNRTIWRISIFGKDNILKYQKKIGFLHPDKKIKLQDAINSYVDYDWNIPSNRKGIYKFVIEKGKLRKERNEIRLLSIKKRNLQNMKKVLNRYEIKSKLFGPWKSSTCSKYYCLIIKEEQLNERNTNWSSSRIKKS